MAAVVPGPELDLRGLRRHLAEHLPHYAAPLFLRVCERMQVTGTFKLGKQHLLRDGFDPAASADASIQLPGSAGFRPGRRAALRAAAVRRSQAI